MGKEYIKYIWHSTVKILSITKSLGNTNLLYAVFDSETTKTSLKTKEGRITWHTYTAGRSWSPAKHRNQSHIWTNCCSNCCSRGLLTSTSASWLGGRLKFPRTRRRPRDLLHHRNFLLHHHDSSRSCFLLQNPILLLSRLRLRLRLRNRTRRRRP